MLRWLILVFILQVPFTAFSQNNGSSVNYTKVITVEKCFGIADSNGNMIIPAKYKLISFVCNGLVVTLADSVYLRTVADSVITSYEFLPIDQETFHKALQACSIPDADLIIRVFSMYMESNLYTPDSEVIYSQEAMAFCMSNPCLSCWLTNYAQDDSSLKQRIGEHNDWIKRYKELKSQGRIRGEEILPEKSKNEQ